MARDDVMNPDAIALHGRDRALQDDEHPRTRFACHVEPLPLAKTHGQPEPVDAGDLSRREQGESLLLAARLDPGARSGLVGRAGHAATPVMTQDTCCRPWSCWRRSPAWPTVALRS